MCRRLARTAIVSSIALAWAACEGESASRAPEPEERPRTAADALARILEDADASDLLEELPELEPDVPRPCGAAADCADQPLARWSFEDCAAGTATLADSTTNDLDLVRSSELQCAGGWSGRALSFARASDVAYARARADLVFDRGLTVALWAKPAAPAAARLQTLMRQRGDGGSTFALVLHDGQYRIVVRLASGQPVGLAAPAPPDRWTHVATTYDGAALRLYLDGSEVASRTAPGAIAREPGPLLLGNDGSRRYFEGELDEARIDARAVPPAAIEELTCQRRDPEVRVAAAPDRPVASGTPVTYTLTVTNRNEASCAPETFLTSVTPPEGEGLRTEPNSTTSPPLAGGESAELAIVITSSEAQESGVYPLRFFARSIARPELVRSTGVVLAANAESTYVIEEPPGCHVAPSRTLLIRHSSVVDDPQRTAADGAWSFGHLAGEFARSKSTAPDAIEAMFRSYASDQTINGFRVRARPRMEATVLAPWPRSETGAFDLARAPMRLLAIAHRLDLVDLPRGRAGEGRFVYGVLGSSGDSLLFTLILEYALPARDEAEAREWAARVHALQSIRFPSEEYNRALQGLTDRYTARGALPDQPNGSALLRIRTNENDLGRDGRWEMREFHLAADGGGLEPAPLAQTPDPSFNRTASLARFIDSHADSILTERHDVPARLDDLPFQAGALINELEHWDADGIANPEARHRFSLNTCDGCHGGETFTSFFHVFPRAAGEQSLLSGFLGGVTGVDPVSGGKRSYNELARRRQLLEQIVCD